MSEAMNASAGAVGDTIDPKVIESLRDLGGGELLRELIDLYLDDSPPRLRHLEEAVRSRDPQLIESLAHGLKSSSANLGAMRLTELCRELEAAGRAENLEPTSALMVESTAEFGRVCEALRALTE